MAGAAQTHVVEDEGADGAQGDLDGAPLLAHDLQHQDVLAL